MYTEYFQKANVCAKKEKWSFWGFVVLTVAFLEDNYYTEWLLAQNTEALVISSGEVSISIEL